MSENNHERIKQSFIRGSLTSSAGVFLAKAIGLFYAVPFTYLAGEKNMVFYSSAYTYYNILLQICSAGLPYAIAAIVAKYANREDYKTVLLVRKLSASILIVSGFIMAMMFVLFSTPLASSILGTQAKINDINTMRNSFIILSIALFLVPILYSYRGFYQGLKDLKIYANTQVVEQLARVLSLLGLGYICVKIFHLPSIWAVYMAITATSIGALIAILYYVKYDQRHIGSIYRMARAQSTSATRRKVILQELFAFGLPYLFASILGNSQTLINTNFFISATTANGLDYQTAKLLLGIIEWQCDKLTSIPQVIGAGFSVGIIPYMTIALENRDLSQLRKNIKECLDTVLYMAFPICFCMMVLAEPIYFVMYGNANLAYGTAALSYSSMLGLCTTLTPICSSLMMTLHLRKVSIYYLLIGFLVKCITFYPFIHVFGYSGAIFSSIACSLSIIYLCLTKINHKYGISYTKNLLHFIKVIISCLAMNGVFVLAKYIGFSISLTNRSLALVELAILGSLGMAVYFFASIKMKLPQAIFHRSIPNIFDKILKKMRKEV